MRKMTWLKNGALALGIAGLLASAPAFSEKPSWVGGGKDRREQGDRQDRQDDRKGEGRSRHERDRRELSGREGRDGRRYDEDRREHFSDENRRYLREYYAERFQAGRCPPGLLKKHNGCMPPGQAKKWRIGRPLPPGVVYYDLPPGVVTQIGPPPSGYRYVRVAGDILMIAVGTAMVMDAIEDLGR